MRLAIVGSGAMGSLFAATLSIHTDLVMLGHWPQQLACLRTAGLTVIHPDESRSTHFFPITDDPNTIAGVDLVLILVKTYQTVRAALEVKQLLSRDGLAVTLQNGLGNVDLLADVLGPERVTHGVTTAGAAMLEPGLLRIAGQGVTHLAVQAKKEEAVRVLADLLQLAGFETYLAYDLDSLAWGKLAVNCGINPLTALLRVPNGTLAKDVQARTLMFAAAEETAAVAQALGIDLPYPDASQRVLEVAQATAANQSSMLQDVLRGSQTEIDAICGAVVRNGRKVGVPTPVNEEFLRLIESLGTRLPGNRIRSKIEPLQILLEQEKGQNN